MTILKLSFLLLVLELCNKNDEELCNKNSKKPILFLQTIKKWTVFELCYCSKWMIRSQYAVIIHVSLDTLYKYLHNMTSARYSSRRIPCPSSMKHICPPPFVTTAELNRQTRDSVGLHVCVSVELSTYRVRLEDSVMKFANLFRDRTLVKTPQPGHAADLMKFITSRLHTAGRLARGRKVTPAIRAREAFSNSRKLLIPFNSPFKWRCHSLPLKLSRCGQLYRTWSYFIVLDRLSVRTVTRMAFCLKHRYETFKVESNCENQLCDVERLKQFENFELEKYLDVPKNLCYVIRHCFL